MRIKNLEPKVKEVLEESELARKDNFVLVNEVYKKLGIETKSSMSYLLENHLQNNLIPFESILRARRKIVKANPELRGNEEKRKEKEQEFYEYALEK